MTFTVAWMIVWLITVGQVARLRFNGCLERKKSDHTRQEIDYKKGKDLFVEQSISHENVFIGPLLIKKKYKQISKNNIDQLQRLTWRLYILTPGIN